MKKILFYLFSTIFLLGGCNKSMDMNNVLNEPNITGIVEQVNEGSILIKANEDEILGGSPLIVSLDVELKESITDYNIGDEVCVYYDGKITRSYPGQINRVYAISLVNPAD